MLYPRLEEITESEYQKCSSRCLEKKATSKPEGLIYFWAEFDTGIRSYGLRRFTVYGGVLNSLSYLDWRAEYGSEAPLRSQDVHHGWHVGRRAKGETYLHRTRDAQTRPRCVYCPGQTQRIHDITCDFGFLKVEELGSRLGGRTSSLQFSFSDCETIWSITMRWQRDDSKYALSTQIGT